MSHQDEVRAIYEPFSWVRPDVDMSSNADFAALAIDVCSGVKTCLQLIHLSDLARSSGAGDEDPPVLDLRDTERLIRLSIAATSMLSDEAHARVERANDAAERASKGGRA